jgi:gliding motility-associated-like protein
MKRNFYLFSVITGFALFFGITSARSQVTVSSSDTVNCTNLCTVLTAHLTGDTPTDAGITLDDIYSPVFPIGFTFNYYGTNYTSVVIGANGTLDFNASDAGLYDPWPITAALLGNPSKYNNICGAWCDIDMFYTGSTVGTETYSTDGVAPFRKFVVTWCGCSMFSCGTQKTTQQIIIYETTNVIEVHMAQKLICPGWNGGYAIIGVQNATGSAATTAPGRDFPSTWSIPPTEAWRFTPTGGGTAYTVASIPYAPVPYASSNIYWYDVTAGTYLGTGGTMTVCPTSPSLYRAAALGCSDTSSGYYFVTTSGGTAFTITSTNPTTCGACNGTITMSGLTPGTIDSVDYWVGSTPQPAYTVVVTAAGTITISGLCAGLYDSIKVKSGTCWSLPSSATLVNPGITMTATSTNPTFCGACNGTITLSGLYGSTTYIITYVFNGTAQPPITMTAAAGGTITISGLCAGSYTNIIATISSSSACVTPPVTATLTNPPISMTGTSTNNSYCGVCDGTIILNGLFATTAYSISYSLGGVAQPPVTFTSSAAGSITITGLCAGTYSNVIATIVSSAGACVTPAIGPFTITAPPPPPLSISGSVNPSQCGYCDGSITIKAITPFSTDTVFYSFNGVAATAITTISHSDSTITLSGLCAGAYTGFTVKVGDCLYTVTGSATLANPSLTAKFDTSIHFGCHGDTVLFTNESYTTPSGGLLYYIWHFGDGSSDTSTSPSHIYAQGTYTVTLLVNNHVCEDSMLMTLPLVHPLIASFIDSPNIICQDELITFTNTSTISGGYPGQFVWSFGTGATDTNKNTTYTFLHTGTYTIQLIATDWVPCSDTVTATVQVDTISGIQIKLSDTVICQGTYVTYTGLYASLGNTGNIWDFGDGSRIVDVNPVVHGYNDPGTFTITVTANYRACQDITTTRTVVVIPQPYMNLGPDTSICKGSESLVLADNLNGNTPGASWLWNTGQTGPSITVVAPGYYYATVNINNCYASDTVWVQNNCYMDIPNVFSPNGDGVNDFFFPRQYLTKGLTTFSMNIYNRWGQLIFTTNTLDGRGWDGKLNNVDQPEGVYVYVIDATFKDGQKEHHQGNVTLLR